MSGSSVDTSTTPSSASATDSRPIPFKLWGLQRTGTNVVRFLLRHNFHVESKERGLEWKHGRIEQPDRVYDGEPLRMIFCVRDPYSWMISCYRYFVLGVRIDKTIDERFVVGPAWWYTPKPLRMALRRWSHRLSRCPSFDAFVRNGHYTWACPAERWNEMNTHWLAHHDAHARCTIMRSEDMLSPESQVRELERIQSELGLERSKETLVTTSARISARSTRLPLRMNFGYFRRRGWREEYDDDLLRFVNDRLDWNLMDRLQYERIPSAG